MFRIGEFSKLAKVTVKALRYYDKIGLLKPAMTDTATSYRYYTEDQLPTVAAICTYKEVGLSIEQIMHLMQEGSDEHAFLEKQRSTLLEKQSEIQKMLSELDSLIRKHPKQEYTARIITVEKRLVYYCRGYITNVQSIHGFIKGCATELTRTNPEVCLSEPDYCCVIYPDNSYRESDIFIEYAQSVDRYGKDTDFLKFKEIESITAVSVVHYGNYANLRDAYAYAVEWARENGYEIEGEPRERYIDGAWNKDDVSLWRTELQLPVKKGKSQ